MNELIASLILAIVQGISEWFPISSSGHLVLFSHLLNFDNTLAFDVALHFGTLMAVFVYFGKDIADIVRDVLRLNFKSEHGKMAIYLVLATIPAGILGFIFHDFFEGLLSNLTLLGFGFGITGVMLLISSLDFKTKRKELSYGIVILMGLAQCASLFRGISRSGSTMCAGVLMGLDQRKAARFSFLMSIPIIFGANVVSFGNTPLPTSYLLPAIVSFVVGLATIHVLLKFVLTSKKNLRWFGVYVLLLSLALLSWIFFF
jgi:undecaprenyl-diphosphatase